MNKYLLLRDNKQSGPFSVDELAKHGLKPYDLVWLEGKSAAWRYPSELEELKPFAPVVEEQPFDRFYKKPETKMQEPPLAKDHTAVKQTPIFLKEDVKPPSAEKPTEHTPEIKIIPSKKIHVSLPVTKSAAPSTDKPLEEKVEHVPSMIEKPRPATDLKTDISADLPYKAKTDAVDLKADFDEGYRENKQKAIGNKIPTHPASVSKVLFRTVAAACLLLGGALIGLIINYNSQQKKFQQLNQLVQEIKQENTGVSVPGPEETTNQEGPSSEEQSSKEQPVYVEDIKIPAEKKDTKQVTTKEPSAPTVLPDTQVHEVETAPVVVQPEEPSPKTERISPELARKNLWQLVSVDHNKFKTGVFGGISNLELKISNKSLYQLEQVEVEIKYIGPEKKVVNTQTVVFENVSPGEQLSLQVPKSSRGVHIDYSIKKINTKELGLAHAGM